MGGEKMRSQITAGEMTVIDKLTVKKHDLEKELESISKVIEFFSNHPELVFLVDFLDERD
jgi:hypothetical protein